MEQGTSDNKDNKRLTSEELMQAVGGSREDPAERQSWFIFQYRCFAAHQEVIHQQ